MEFQPIGDQVSALRAAKAEVWSSIPA